MQIFINSQTVDVAPGECLEAILVRQKLDVPGTAVAVDGRVVSRDKWSTFFPCEGVRVMVFKAACGG